MPGQQNQVSVALQPVQPHSSSCVHPPNPSAENVACKIVAWVVASVVGQKTDGRGALELVSVIQVFEPKMGVFVGLALPQHVLRVRDRGMV